MGNYSLILSLLLFLALGQCSYSLSACNIPSRFWCDSPEIAAECGVTKQCKALHNSTAKLVQFALYYETMCPGCKQFFSSQLAPAYEKVGSIMNLTLVPFGNSEWHTNTYLPFTFWFSCQHGPDECMGNIIETAAIHLYDIKVYFPFINCIEKSPLIPAKAAIGCAHQYSVNHTAVMDLVNSRPGHVLELKMGEKTQSLRPKHQYVPWVTLNGVHTEGIQDMAMKDLVKLICDTYTGSPKPAACST